jgi:hypothetical protein
MNRRKALPRAPDSATKAEKSPPFPELRMTPKIRNSMKFGAKSVGFA